MKDKNVICKDGVPKELCPSYYFDPAQYGFAEVFSDVSFVWEAVALLQRTDYVDRTARTLCSRVARSGKRATTMGNVELRVSPGAEPGPTVVISGEGGVVSIDEGAEVRPGTIITVGANAVYIGRGASVGPNVHIDAAKGSIVVADRANLRQCAYLRELTIVGSSAIVGNSCEVKCSIIGPAAEVPHFNYVGDSLLGFKSHLGAGVKISNLKITDNTVRVRYGGDVFDTGLRKFGIILGDLAQMGCNAVSNPGTLVGKNSLVYGTSCIGGFIPASTIVKCRQPLEYVKLRRKEPVSNLETCDGGPAAAGLKPDLFHNTPEHQGV